MTKKELKKLIKNDIETNYNVNYNEEEALSHFVVKEKVKNTKLRIALNYAVVCLIGIVLGIVICIPLGKFGGQNNITEEFEAFVNKDGDYICENNLKYNLNFYDRCNIIIYRVESKDIANYYYIIKIDDFIIKPYLFYKNQKLELTHNSFGLLDSFDKNKEEETLKFHIEVDGKTIEYVLN